MRCPYCQSDQTCVIDSRESSAYNGSVRRRRQCMDCDTRFSTAEVIVKNGAINAEPEDLATIRRLMDELDARLRLVLPGLQASSNRHRATPRGKMITKLKAGRGEYPGRKEVK